MTTIQGYRLSPAQHDLWRLAGTPRCLGRRVVVSVDGCLDAEALRAAVLALTDRYEILRTSFHDHASAALRSQQIETARVAWHDIAIADGTTSRRAAGELLAASAVWQYDPASGTPLHAGLARRPDGQLLLVLAVPSLCADATSIEILLEDLADIAATVAPDPAVPLQYADIAEWEHVLLQSAEQAEGRAFWAGTDVDALRSLLLTFPAEMPPATPAQSSWLDLESLRNPLTEFARHCDCIPGDVLLAAWCTSVARLARQERIVCAIDVKERSIPELGRAVGPCTRLAPLGCRIEPTSTLAQLSRDIARDMRSIVRWQNHVDWSAVMPHGHIAPFGFLRTSSGWTATRGGVRWAAIASTAELRGPALVLAVDEAMDGLTARCLYDPARWSSRDFDIIAKEYFSVLRDALHEPNKALSSCGSGCDARRSTVRVAHALRPGTQKIGIVLPDEVSRTRAATRAVQSGAVFTILNPAASTDHLRATLERAGLDVIVTTETLREWLPSCGDAVVTVDDEQTKASSAGEDFDVDRPVCVRYVMTPDDAIEPWVFSHRGLAAWAWQADARRLAAQHPEFDRLGPCELHSFAAPPVSAEIRGDVSLRSSVGTECAAGELCLTGDLLPLECWGRPDVTADRLRPDPLNVGERMMPTGYLGARSADGTIEIRGRVGDEIVRDGITVSVHAVERALALHPALHDVALATGPAGLTAFVVLAPGAPAPSVDELSAAVGLPRSHAPSALVLTGALPRRADGSVDRVALAALARGGGRPAYVAPRDEIERTLCEIWRDTLGIDRVGIHDDFLDLGGDSIVSIRVAARAARSGLHFTPVDLFRYPTVASLAPVVRVEAGQPMAHS